MPESALLNVIVTLPAPTVRLSLSNLRFEFFAAIVIAFPVPDGAVGAGVAADTGLGVANEPDAGVLRVGATPLPWLDGDFGGYVGANPGGYQFALDYRRAPRGIPGLALRDLLESRVDAAAVRGRVAILATRSPSVTPRRPWRRASRGADGRSRP